MIRIHTYTDSLNLERVLQRPAHRVSRIEKIVKPILTKVKRGGDMALRKFALEYDHVELDELWVQEEEFEGCEQQVDKQLRKAIEQAKDNIWTFHEAQIEQPIEVETMPGVKCARRSVPIERVGLYIPGGTAPLFSTVLMLGIPARIAGCHEIVLATPTNKVGDINPVVLYTARLLDIRRILKVGGAQAIAAMAFGTESVPKVDKILGPGNQYVTVAKQLVSKDAVAIDMPAGPSEVMVVADQSARPSYVAADLLSQAEHGPDSQAILVTDTVEFAHRVIQKVEKQLAKLPRKDVAAEALKWSRIIVTRKKSEVLRVINTYGPEHLILNSEHAAYYAEHIVNAGSVFIGPNTPESAGDYASGTNHTLPTNGWARAYSGVSVDSFVKKITFQEISEKGLRKLGPLVQELAAAEHLEGHKHAVTVRLKHLSK